MFEKYLDFVHRLAAELGWAGSVDDGAYRTAHDYLPASGRVTAEQYARWVILSEGDDPDGGLSQKQGWIKTISDLFVECLGTDEIDIAHITD